AALKSASRSPIGLSPISPIGPIGPISPIPIPLMPDPAITALIVDDEPLGRDLVRHMLAAHRDIRVAADCADGEKALAAIKRHTPHVVFLDIKMPRLDGITLLERLD